MKQMTKEELRKYLEEAFKGRTLVFRRDPVLTQFVSGGTLANWDSEKRGIEGAVKIGNKTFYPALALIDRLVENSNAE
ncbi:MAG: hypothetical protein NTV58_06310 [Deltaproteobacteria bacterium]|nr:hypothetical protein [Deltaproteobacteria bacterium]